MSVNNSDVSVKTQHRYSQHEVIVTSIITTPDRNFIKDTPHSL